MPWDTSLNQDVKAGVEKQHVAMTHDLDKSDPRKFSLSTPQRGSSAFIGVLESVPSSEGIIHDIKNIFKSLKIVCKGKCTKVDGVGNANVGVQYIPVLKKNSGGGGAESEQRMIMGTTLLCIRMPCKQQRSSWSILRKQIWEVTTTKTSKG
jgi:hypothetical protein